MWINRWRSPKSTPWLWLLLVGLGFRIAYLILAPQRQPVSDDGFYWATAQSLAHGDGYTYQGRPATAWMPGFPILLASWVWIFGARVWVMRLLLALLSAATVPVVWRTSRRWFGPRVAWWSTLGFAVFPPMWFFATALLSETPAIFFVLLVLDFAGQLRRRFDWLRAFGLGASYVALLYLKPEFVFLGPLYLGVALARPLVLVRRAAVVMCFLGAVSLTPWTLRNWRLYHEFIPLKTTGGITLWWASQHPPILEVDLADPRFIDAERRFVVPGKPGQTANNYSSEARRRIVAAPLRYLVECVTVRARFLFFGSQSEATVGLSRAFADLRVSREWLLVAIKIGLFAVQASLSILGLAGVLLLSDPERCRTLARVHLLANTAIYVAMIGVTRYSMVLMPILIPHAMALVGRTLVRYAAPVAHPPQLLPPEDRPTPG
jgi:Dolichyl-phosphate-mannose-protein mannosyltransferase